MIVTGAWHSRPKPNYYFKLVLDHVGIPSPFMDEIEKDVRRYVHDAFSLNGTFLKINATGLFLSIPRINLQLALMLFVEF